MVYIHLIVFTGCILVNTLLPKQMHFDAYPFAFLMLSLSVEAIFLSFFIITQNKQGEIDDRPNQLDLQINLLAEQGNTKVLWMLKRIAEHAGVDLSDDPELDILEEATPPAKLIEQIDKARAES